MSDDRRMTTDRFYGGVQGRLQNLRKMLSYVDDTTPDEDDLVQWIIANTPADSEKAVKKHLGFIEGIDLIRRENGVYLLDDYGRKYHEHPDASVLYNALTSGVKGFQTLLRELDEGPMTDEDIMDLLVTTYDECEMTTSGPAIRHREWLQAIEYLNRENGINRITDDARSALDGVPDQERIENLQRQLRQ